MCPRKGRCCWSGCARAAQRSLMTFWAMPAGAGCGPAAAAGAGGTRDDRGQYQPAGPRDAERFAELGVFAEDETIPFGLVARLWRATAGLDDLRAAQVCKRLAQLALVSQARRPGRRHHPA